MFRRRKPAPDPLRDQLAQLVRSWQQTSTDLHVNTLKPGAGREHRLVSDAQARILATAAHELHQLLKDET